MLPQMAAASAMWGTKKVDAPNWTNIGPAGGYEGWRDFIGQMRGMTGQFGDMIGDYRQAPGMRQFGGEGYLQQALGQDAPTYQPSIDAMRSFVDFDPETVGMRSDVRAQTQAAGRAYKRAERELQNKLGLTGGMPSSARDRAYAELMGRRADTETGILSQAVQQGMQRKFQAAPALANLQQQAWQAPFLRAGHALTGEQAYTGLDRQGYQLEEASRQQRTAQGLQGLGMAESTFRNSFQPYTPGQPSYQKKPWAQGMDAFVNTGLSMASTIMGGGTGGYQAGSNPGGMQWSNQGMGSLVQGRGYQQPPPPPVYSPQYDPYSTASTFGKQIGPTLPGGGR